MDSLNPYEVGLISQFTEGTLTPENAIVFDNLIATNEAFAAEVNAYKEAILAVQFQKYSTLKNLLKDEEAKILSETKPIFRLRQLRGWAAAASIAILAIAGFFLLKSSNKSLTNENLLANFYSEPFETRWLSVNKGGPEDEEERFNINQYGESAYKKLREGWGLYLSGQYAESVDVFSKLNIPNDTFLMARGNAFYQNNQASKAIDDLIKIAQNSQSKLKEEAEWRLISAYIKNNDMGKAKELCEKITQTNKHKYAKNAELLLPELKRH